MTNDSSSLKDKGQIKKAHMTNDSRILKDKGQRTKIKGQIKKNT